MLKMVQRMDILLLNTYANLFSTVCDLTSSHASQSCSLADKLKDLIQPCAESSKVIQKLCSLVLVNSPVSPKKLASKNRAFGFQRSPSIHARPTTPRSSTRSPSEIVPNQVIFYFFLFPLWNKDFLD